MRFDEHHQRRLEATVQLLEESIARCHRLLDGDGQAILRVVRTSIDDSTRRRLILKLERLHASLERFAAHFDLPRRPVELAQVLNAEFSNAWVMLENCRPKRMNGYGVKFDPAAAESLNESVDLLLKRVQSPRDEVVEKEGE